MDSDDRIDQVLTSLAEHRYLTDAAGRVRCLPVDLPLAREDAARFSIRGSKKHLPRYAPPEKI